MYAIRSYYENNVNNHTKIKENCILRLKFNCMKSKFYLLSALALIILQSCSKSSGSDEVELRDRQEVYDENIVEIETYLQSNYMTVDSDMNVIVDSIDAGQTSIWDEYNMASSYITVKNDDRNTLLTDGRVDDDVDYKLYYVVLRNNFV